jgi:nitric oxide reductase large subunit
MATKGKGATPSRKTSIPVGSFPVPPIPMDGNRSGNQDWESVMGWIAACVLLVVLLPLLGMLYVDVLQTKHEAKQQVEKVEKLRKQVEQQQKKGSKDE